MTFRTHLEIEVEVTARRIPDEPANDVRGCVEIEAAEVVAAEVVAAAPGWSGKVPIALGRYWFRMNPKAKAQAAYLGERTVNIDTIDWPLREILTEFPKAQWAPMLRPGEAVAVRLSLGKLPKSTIDEWEVRAMREVAL